MTDANLMLYWEALCDLIINGEFDHDGAMQEAARMAGIERIIRTLH